MSTSLSAASGFRRTILLFGYWPPTDIGISTRNGILWNFRTLQENYKSSGYDVIAFSPTFRDITGYNAAGWDQRQLKIPEWGAGTGDLTVDYVKTSQFFWKTVLFDYPNPIAILSFSRGSYTNNWSLERYAYNYAQSVWLLTLQYYPPTPWPPTAPPANFTIVQPFAGGDPSDSSPYKNHKVIQGISGPITGNPPDPSLAPAVTAFPPPAGAQKRESTLPIASIITAIQGLHIPTTRLNPLDNTNASLLGNYVSAYMAYHVCWYQAFSQQTYDGMKVPSLPCKMAGHTHVGINVSVADGQAALNAQLDTVIKAL